MIEELHKALGEIIKKGETIVDRETADHLIPFLKGQQCELRIGSVGENIIVTILV